MDNNSSFSLPEISLELSVEQKFSLAAIELAAKEKTKEELASLLVQATAIMMAKDNAIRGLLKR
jgi:hypothetical protein